MTEPQTTSHPIAEGVDLTVAYPETGKNAGYAELHATGCRHLDILSRSRYGAPSHVGVIGADWTGPLADDYFAVAPCARKGGRK